MKSKKNKVRGGMTRKEYYNLGKKITLGLVAATLLMDGVAMAAQETIIDNNNSPYVLDIRVAGVEENIGGEVTQGNLVIKADGQVGRSPDDPAGSVSVDAYGAYTVNGNTYDGVHWADTVNKRSNILDVEGIVYGFAYGGYTGDGNADYNYNKIVGGAAVHGEAYGGHSVSNGSANNNRLDVYGYTYDDLYGGYAADGSANSNVVDWGGTQINKDNVIYGGYAKGDSSPVNPISADDNKVYINNNTFEGDVIGGKHIGNNGSVKDNRVTINGVGGVKGDVYGGIAVNYTAVASGVSPSTVQGNKVTVSADAVKGIGSVVGTVTGGEVIGTGNVVGNDVEVNGKVNGDVIGGSISGAYHMDTVFTGHYVLGVGSATENTVTITGEVNGTAIGAMVTEGASAGGYDNVNNKSLGNKVLVSGGTVKDAIGAASAEKEYEDVNNVKHTVVGTGDLQYNEVVVEKNGKVENKAIGAVSSSGQVGIAGVADTQLKYNSVTVKDGEVRVAIGAETDGAVSANSNETKIEGGTVDKAYGAISKSSGSLTNNSVTISQGDIHATPNPDPATKVRNATGGWSFSNDITTIDSNSVTIDGGLVTGQLAGGKYLGEGKTTVRNNTVTVNGGEFKQNDPDNVYRGINAAGAISFGSGLVSENKVIIGDTPVVGANIDISTVAGAVSTNGKLLQNSADVKEGTVYKSYGAIADGATSAEGNYVNVTGDGTNVSNAVGALGQKVDGSNFINNKVTIGEDIVTSPQVQTSPTVGDAAGAITSSYGYDGDGVNHRYNGIHGNRVIINSGEVTGAASGAISLYEDDEAQNIHRDVRVHNNYVDVKNGTVKEANGAVITGSARAEQNSVTVENGTVTHANGARIDGTGNAKGNKVNVEGGSVDHAIGAYGSTENAGELTGNTVIIEETTPGNTNIKKVAAGAVSHGSNLVSKNKVEINGGTVTSAAGAVSYSEESAARLEENTVRITGGDTTTAQGAIVRGAATAANNKVDVVAGTVDTIIGAVDHGNGTLIGNEANVNGNDNGLPVEVHDVIGAKSDGSGTLKGNSANINADVTVDNVIGAEITGDATADGNIVNIDYGTVTSAAGALSAAEPGGTAQVRGALTNNIVNIGAVDDVNSNPTVYNAVGAASESSEKLSGNAVIMNKGTITAEPGKSEPGRLIGAWYFGTESSTVADNSVIINGGNIESSTEVVGAKSSGTGRVDRNMVIVNSFTHDPANPGEPLNQVVGATVNGTANAEGNAVIIDDEFDGKIDSVVGAIGKSTHKSVFNKNAVQINGGTIGEAIGADTVAGDVLNSEVTVSGGTVTESIFGGMSETGDVIGSRILLSGGTVEGTVYGGKSDKGAVRNNVITIRDNVNLDGAKLYGYDGNAEGGHSGNTLNIEGKIVYKNFDDIKAGNWSWSTWADRGNQKLDTIDGFDNINIDEAVWGTPAITVDNLILDNTNVHVNHVFAPSISKRSEIYNGTGANIIYAENITDKDGNPGTLNPNSKIDRIDFGVSLTATDVPINLNHINGEETRFDAGQLIVNEQTQVIAESRTVSTALINQAGDLMADALRAMSKSTSVEGTLYGEKSFAAIHGNSSKYKTGSHVKVNGWSGIAGVGNTMDNGITWGIFLETGGGNYTTHNEIYGYDITGDGKANYTGGGVAFRQDLNDGLYYDAGFRVGSLKNELKDALQGPMGFYGYDVSTTYYGLHFGVGKVFQSDPDNSVEIYGRYFYTRHGGKDFDIAGDQFSFDSVNSNRLKLGVMMENKLDDRLKLRYGLGWEYEFGGKAGSSTWGYDLTSPSLKGSSISYDLGLSYSTSDNSSLELNVSGHSGKRQGISGSVMFNVTF